MSNKITIYGLINTNTKVKTVILKTRQLIFNESFETDLGKYYTVIGVNYTVELSDCKIPLNTEVLNWMYNGSGELTLVLNPNDLGVKSC